MIVRGRRLHAGLNFLNANPKEYGVDCGSQKIMMSTATKLCQDQDMGNIVVTTGKKKTLCQDTWV